MMKHSLYYSTCKILCGSGPFIRACLRPLIWLGFLSSFLSSGWAEICTCVNELRPPGDRVDDLGAKDADSHHSPLHQSMSLLFPPVLNLPLPCLETLLYHGYLWNLYHKYLQVTHLLQVTHFIMILLYNLFSWSFASKDCIRINSLFVLSSTLQNQANIIIA